MTRLSDILNEDDLAREIEAGFVSVREHEDDPNLVVLNYTDECAFSRNWTDVTRKTRGLIYRKDTGEIVARAFNKFFNHGEPEAPEIDLDDQVRVVDKMDGSLGVLYVAPDDEVAVATRGSFNSDQATWATRWIREQPVGVRDAIRLVMQENYTPVVEIVYKENRIVVQYETEGLISLGMVDNGTGEVQRWDLPAIPSAEHFGDMTFREALEMEPRPNAEGIVVMAGATSDYFVKIKQEDYVALHRIISHLTEKEVWRQLRDGTYDDYVVKLPDEFYDWAVATADGLKAEAARWEAEVYEWERDMYLGVPEDATRKDQAIWITQNVPATHRGLVFSVLDGKSLVEPITRLVEPRGV